MLRLNGQKRFNWLMSNFNYCSAGGKLLFYPTAKNSVELKYPHFPALPRTTLMLNMTLLQSKASAYFLDVMLPLFYKHPAQKILPQFFSTPFPCGSMDPQALG